MLAVTFFLAFSALLLGMPDGLARWNDRLTARHERRIWARAMRALQGRGR